MPSIKNLVHQTSSSTGTGDLTLATVNGKQPFATAFGTGAPTDVFYYFISNRNAAEWEYGTGHMSDSTTLVRDTVIESTNSNAAVSFSAGTLDVVNDLPWNKQVNADDLATVATSGDYSDLSGTPTLGALAAGDDASDVPFTPTGGISSTDVAGALAELDSEKQAADADLTS
ncbi:MAG TPA: hypothetical protein VHA53_06070, partial [Nitrolancea sp.]|nr:hypothetical protein [Nitrolancea sp.]